LAAGSEVKDKPHIVLVMADDMGWGQTSYRGHPLLRTPNLDTMAASGLRFERFYAAGAVCSPTRASVLTGRSPERCGVLSHGYALRLQEKTLAQALRAAGYITGHFGKWHLDGLQGPGAPVLLDDPYHPGHFGFEEWVSVTNYFDRNPLLSRRGAVEEFEGDSSEIIVREALRFLETNSSQGKPLFAVIWFGSPHSPFWASDEDRQPFANVPERSAHHYGELVALDRAVGTLRHGLRQLGLADNTLLVFCSDNGGLPNIRPDTVGGLRGYKGSLYEGGIRVPGIIEWPRVIRPRVTHFPAGTVDLFPTIADLLELPDSVFVQPIDGISLKRLFTEELSERPQPLGFRFQRQSALIDNRWKIHARRLPSGEWTDWQLYDLDADPAESQNLAAQQPEQFERLKKRLLEWNVSVDASFAGKDYPGGRLDPPDPEPRPWHAAPWYRPYLESWKNRWEFRSVLSR
jgi:arylsulfatase A-like enzyme